MHSWGSKSQTVPAFLHFFPFFFFWLGFAASQAEDAEPRATPARPQPHPTWGTCGADLVLGGAVLWLLAPFSRQQRSIRRAASSGPLFLL